MAHAPSAREGPYCPKCKISVIHLKRHESGYHQMSCSVRYEAGTSVRCQRDPLDKLFHCSECDFKSTYPSSLQRHVGKCAQRKRKIRKQSRGGRSADLTRKKKAVTSETEPQPIDHTESDGYQSEVVLSSGDSSASTLSRREVVRDVGEGIPESAENQGRVTQIDQLLRCEAKADHLSSQLELGVEPQNVDMDDLQLQYPDSDDCLDSSSSDT